LFSYKKNNIRKEWSGESACNNYTFVLIYKCTGILKNLDYSTIENITPSVWITSASIITHAVMTNESVL